MGHRECIVSELVNFWTELCHQNLSLTFLLILSVMLKNQVAFSPFPKLQTALVVWLRGPIHQSSIFPQMLLKVKLVYCSLWLSWMGSLCHSLSDQPVIQQKNGMLCSTDMALMEILRSDRAFFFLSSYTFKHSYLDIGNHSTLGSFNWSFQNYATNGFNPEFVGFAKGIAMWYAISWGLSKRLVCGIYGTWRPC